MKLPERLQEALVEGAVRIVTEPDEHAIKAYVARVGTLQGRVLVATIDRDAAIEDDTLRDDWRLALQLWLERCVERARKAAGLRPLPLAANVDEDLDATRDRELA